MRRGNRGGPTPPLQPAADAMLGLSRRIPAAGASMPPRRSLGAGSGRPPPGPPELDPDLEQLKASWSWNFADARRTDEQEERQYYHPSQRLRGGHSLACSRCGRPLSMDELISHQSQCPGERAASPDNGFGSGTRPRWRGPLDPEPTSLQLTRGPRGLRADAPDWIGQEDFEFGSYDYGADFLRSMREMREELGLPRRYVQSSRSMGAGFVPPRGWMPASSAASSSSWQRGRPQSPPSDSDDDEPVPRARGPPSAQKQQQQQQQPCTQWRRQK
eukprot:gnl/TRDRNA2_/TRDRNA2_84952_c1_seq1.p1 gnl/TRDRNA2_/TRDRNA2_84952_c1~~gnl/TRDRNA2_/TRDRNA2_84952_c1_seq1.p1  ORF type:complete len:310 (-),score=33.59 gnl/TRDRNA2_/TRDRNA2_84952_c1_seq1:593-1411(-)